MDRGKRKVPMVWVGWVANEHIRCTGVMIAATAPFVARGLTTDEAAIAHVRSQEQHLEDDPSIPVFIVKEDLAGLMMYNCCKFDHAAYEANKSRRVGTWCITPNLDAFRERAKGMVREVREIKRNSGVDWKGTRIDTTVDSVSAIAAKATTAFMADGNYKVSMKLNGKFQTLTKHDIINLHRQVDAHIQSAFDEEERMCEEIDSISAEEPWDAVKKIRDYENGARDSMITVSDDTQV